jgi:hypothetical protein
VVGVVFFAAVAAALITGCQETDGRPVSSTPIGSTCVPPVNQTDSVNLPRGVGFCMGPSAVYPKGYFSMNCCSDNDCPSDAECDGACGAGQLTWHCRKRCAADSECTAPSHCVPAGPRYVPICQYPEGVAPIR